ncbi:MAG: methionine-S-sulfoxide reductase [Hyphomicrobiales bacterium]|jgi:peptide-methionine (S)-S-oxide reductase|nr:methionine-S-sulfoxide reductase [Hyphomicrobiales bacterium]
MKRILMGIFSLALIMAMPLMPAPAAAQAGQATAIFAGGCFWCLESDMDKVKGVLSTTSGYTGGGAANPTYEQVSAGKTGHAEAVKVVYDPGVVSYKELLYVFWRNIDPLTANAQFCDHGTQYRAAIFYGNDEEKRAAEASKAELAGRFPQPIVTQIVPASTFYPAEDYHQDYYKKNPVKYKFYRTTCGRDRRLQEVWGKEAGAHGSS